ncbi:MAG: YitT family protein [Clostridiaceae bacterium]|nr:YitT family protein [Clostridiaceae bacterium]
MKKDWRKNPILRYAIVLLGSVIYAAAISLFLDPNQLAPGGVSGLAIIINRLTSLPTGVLMLCMNIPLMIIGIWKLGLRFFISTIVAIGVSSWATDFLAPLGPLTRDPLLAAAAGGSLMALGMGLLFKVGATSGGSDIIVRLIKLKYKYIKTGKLFLMTDACVVTLSAIVFKNIDLGLYAAIAILVSSMVFDLVLYGRDEAKLVYIITEKEEEITGRILSELEIGVTHLDGTGAYTEKPKQVILCAMQKRLLPQVQDIAMQEDPFAFLIITSASEVYGEGFKDLRGERL